MKKQIVYPVREINILSTINAGLLLNVKPTILILMGYIVFPVQMDVIDVLL